MQEETKIKPSPISYTIKPLSDLIDPYWKKWLHTDYEGNLGSIPVYESEPDGEKLNGTRINEFFEKKLGEYCKVILGYLDCPMYEAKGCGINSFCPIENGQVASCIDDNDKDSKNGYKCVQGDS